MAIRVRNWVFTLNNPTEESTAELLTLAQQSTYLVVGREKAASGTPHLQGYVVLKKKTRLGGLRKLFSRSPHFEAARGSHEEASDYCKKDGDFTEYGVLPKDPGVTGKEMEQERWDQARLSAQAGDFDAIPSDIYLRYYRTIKEVAKDHLKAPPNLEGEEIKMEWWYGDSGTGKSRKARETYPQAYLKMCNKWWDGYQGQEVVLIEDFDRCHSVLGHHLKIWADRYAFLAETKGGAIAIRPKLIVVTTNYSLESIFGDEPMTLEPLLRRFNQVKF